jgi:hypothetical protein
MNMTRVQELEMRRFTNQMWLVLWYAKRVDPLPAAVCGTSWARLEYSSAAAS